MSYKDQWAGVQSVCHDEAHRWIIFDPIPRIDGVEPLDDSLIELGAAVYLLNAIAVATLSDRKWRLRNVLPRQLAGRYHELTTR